MVIKICSADKGGMKLAMENTSLLYRNEVSSTSCEGASLFSDLNIGQIINAVTEGYEEHGLKELYSQRPDDAKYPMAVARDLWDDDICGVIERFQIKLNKAKSYLCTAESVHPGPIRGKWKLDAAVEYVEAISTFTELADKVVASEGLERFLNWLQTYTQTEEFIQLRNLALPLKRQVDSTPYALTLDFSSDTIYWSEDVFTEDVCADLMKAFDRFDLRHINSEITAFAGIHMNLLEEKIFAIMKKKYPDLLAQLTRFDAHVRDIIHEKIFAFEKESLFFISYIKFAKQLESKGVPFSFPCYTSQRFCITGGYDASLALIRGSGSLVAKNDFEILEGESSFILTGPNQGGKTTFSRMLGQIIFFASRGLPVPCERADVYHTCGIKTHFNIEESPGGDTGRLKEELIRLKQILADTAEKSVVILNELFSSTTTYDGLEMGKQILRLFKEKNCICLYITHLHGLASEDGAISLIAEMSDDKPTFRITRDPTTGNAFAIRLLAKHRLCAGDIKERTNAAFSII